MNLRIYPLGGKGVPLVMFHGWGFDSQVWAPLAPALQQHAHLYLVDLPGFGQSALMDWECFKSQLLHQLPEQFAVVGWSMGGSYAIRLASECPDRVTQLVGICASPKLISENDWPGIDAKMFDVFMSQFVSHPAETLQSFVMAQTGKILQVDAARLPSLAALEAGLKLIKSWDLRQALLTVPQACFMFGRLDAIVPARTLKAMQSQFPQFKYVLFERDAHMPFMSNQQRFLLELTHLL